MAERVVVAMSGGVDSCVAAAVLKEQGYEVIGITMQLWNHGDTSQSRFDSCCSLADVHDARVAAHQIGVPHYLVNYEKEFRQGVVDYFAAEYAAGRTPNPCVMCNSKLKFDHLVERAKALGADWVATGHYARVKHFDDGRPSQLFRGQDSRKDQSYFLFDVKPEYLKRSLFPLADLSKPEVREIAAHYGMATAKKHESQEICFVSGKRYTEFLDQHYPEVKGQGPGKIVSPTGEQLGDHQGIYQYTVGQRKGLGHLKTITPKYVVDIDPDKNQVVVDEKEALNVASFRVGQVNWLGDTAFLTGGEEVTVVPRYRAKPTRCLLRPVGEGEVEVQVFEPLKWVTPGQAAVFYRDDLVLGGGFINRSLTTQRPSQWSSAEVGGGLHAE